MGTGRIELEDLRSLAFGSIVAGYTAIGTAFEHPIIKMKLHNQTDALLFFSNNGVDDKEELPAGGFLLLDITAEGKESAYGGKNQTWYVKRSGVPTTGSVYLSTYYRSDLP